MSISYAEEEKREMGNGNQSPLYNAAREARKAATRARDFADLCERYAQSLLTPGC